MQNLMWFLWCICTLIYYCEYTIVNDAINYNYAVNYAFKLSISQREIIYFINYLFILYSEDSRYLTFDIS